MSKVKIPTGLAAVLLIGAMFAGWQTLLIVSVLILIFCELDDNLKSLMIKVITFFVGISLVSMAWNLIVDGYDVVYDSLDDLLTKVIGSYANKPIDISNLYRYLLTPLKGLIDIGDNIISWLITFSKFGFIVALISNKAAKNNPVLDKINDYVSKVITFINNLDFTNNQPTENK